MATYRLRQEPRQTGMANELIKWFGKYWFQMTIAVFLWQLYANREVSLSMKELPPIPVKASAKAEANVSDQLAVPVSFFEETPSKPTKRWKPTDFKNLSFVFNPKLAKEKQVDEAIVQAKMAACRRYVERFAATAMAEMKQFGIPASITLAQGLLETDAGGSRLATDSNNHFGIKCRSKCRHCTCRNYSDDDVYDMFRVFDTSWESFREHSKLLQIGRYKHLHKLGSKDYEGWAKGLKRAGYATDKQYDKKLIQIIEALDLHQFDK